MAALLEFALDQLPKALRGAYSALRSFAAQQTPVSTVIKDLRAAGYAFRTQTLTDVYAAIRGKADVNQFIRSFGLDTPIPNALHKNAVLRFNEGAKYQYLVLTNSEDPLTPEAIYVNSYTALSANEIFAKAEDAFTYEDRPGMEPADLGGITFEIDDARWMPGELL